MYEDPPLMPGTPRILCKKGKYSRWGTLVAIMERGKDKQRHEFLGLVRSVYKMQGGG